MGYPVCDDLRNGSATSDNGICTLCPTGNYKHGLGQPCRGCGSADGLTALRTGAFIWAFAAFVCICWRQVARNGGNTPPGRAGAQILATMLEHTQLMAVLLILPWHYPDGLLNAAELPASFLGADLPAMFRVDCMEADDGGEVGDGHLFATRWWFSQGLFFGVLLCLLVISLVSRVMSKPAAADKFRHRALVIYGLFLSAIVRGAAGVHDCVQHGDAYVVDHSPEVACDYDGVYSSYALASGGMIQVAFLLPMITFSKLKDKHARTSSVQ
jgi:hypothetical protein